MTAEEQIVQAMQQQAAGDLPAAVRICRQIVQEQPAHAQAIHLLGLLCHRMDHSEEAVTLLRQSVEIRPDDTEFLCNLAAILGSKGRLEESLQTFDHAIELQPAHARLHGNRGATLERMGRLSEARDAYRRALSLTGEADSCSTHTNLASVLKKLADYDGAEQHYRQALRIEPTYALAWHNLAWLCHEEARHSEAIDAMKHSVTLRPLDAALHSDLLYCLHYDPQVDRASMFKHHQDWAKAHEPVEVSLPPFLNDRAQGRRLRVGYVSPHFRHHAIATFFEPLLSGHDRRHFEVFLYSFTQPHDDCTQRLRQACGHWRDLNGFSDAKAAEQIRADRIDILVDLTGHTGENRLLLFAHRPAPVQVAYLGYPDTTGLNAMDYRLTDNHLDPPENSERFHSEALVHLAGPIGCYLPNPTAPQITETPALKCGYITFGCLNNPAKLNTTVFSLWCKLLQAVPHSKLLLRYTGRPTILQQVLADSGIDSSRIEWLRKLPNEEAYLKTFNRIDIALDPFPYNGHTTSCDGFWMGVPLVTLAGDRYVSRMGVSLLYALGLPELIAHSEEEFIRVTAALAQDLPRLNNLRQSLRPLMQSSALTDGKTVANEVEAAYVNMWKEWCLRRRTAD
jgi:protein O-GlcNAc transferase